MPEASMKIEMIIFLTIVVKDSYNNWINWRN